MQQLEDYQIKQTFYRKYGKRMFDFIFSVSALALLSPFLLLIALLLRLYLGSPVIFKQKRPGLHEKIFTLYKFRTMTNQKDKQGNLLADAIRLTKFGKLLRSTSMDELPELWNVATGDMSFVGPRPLLIQYLPLYTKKQRMRHQLRPGLTGLAQISGRNGIDWEYKFKFDIEYIKQRSLFVDFCVILATIVKIIKREGISQDGEATMEFFKGA